MLHNASSSRNCCAPDRAEVQAAEPRAVWLVTALSGVLIVTTVVDILGSLLVIVSVLKNRKLRNSVLSADT